MEVIVTHFSPASYRREVKKKAEEMGITKNIVLCPTRQMGSAWAYWGWPKAYLYLPSKFSPLFGKDFILRHELTHILNEGKLLPLGLFFVIASIVQAIFTVTYLETRVAMLVVFIFNVLFPLFFSMINFWESRVREIQADLCAHSYISLSDKAKILCGWTKIDAWEKFSYNWLKRWWLHCLDIHPSAEKRGNMIEREFASYRGWKSFRAKIAWRYHSGLWWRQICGKPLSQERKLLFNRYYAEIKQKGFF